MTAGFRGFTAVCIYVTAHSYNSNQAMTGLHRTQVEGLEKESWM